MDGWIKLHRKVLENPIACKDSDHIAVWNYLLLNATYKSYSTLLDGKSIVLLPGQLITGRKVIAEKFKIDESKVQRILKLFESEQLIEQLTSVTCRLISIRSWDEYQSGEQPNEQLVNNDRTTSEQRVNTIQEGNKDKKEKKATSVGSDVPPAPPTIEIRKKEFADKLIPFVDKYGKTMIRSFYEYWTEKGEKDRKMRFEKEKVFEVTKRLATWKLIDENSRFNPRPKSNERRDGQFVA